MYEVFIEKSCVPVKAWIKGIPPIEDSAKRQLLNIAGLPFVYKHIAVMPDVHLGKGATVGSVVPTKGAIIPAAVGVDIGCGMIAARTTLTSNDIPKNLRDLRFAIEAVVPCGEGKSRSISSSVKHKWYDFFDESYRKLVTKYPQIESKRHPVHQIGTLGGGNHFIELCLDESDQIWIMLHSGSRGIGNRIGNFFISRAKEEMEKYHIRLADKDLSYLVENTELFDDYIEALLWAQDYAADNRRTMLKEILDVMKQWFKPFSVEGHVVSCHHNFAVKENHYNENVWVTRKGAVRARTGDLGIIPGSMSDPSFIVRGKGNPESFHSCSHGAGRIMSRSAAKKNFTLEDHAKSVEGIECRVDEGVLDETSGAYKRVNDVIAAQEDLVEVVHTLKQFLNCKG